MNDFRKIDLLIASIKTSLDNALGLVYTSDTILDEMKTTLEEMNDLMKGISNETDSR